MTFKQWHPTGCCSTKERSGMLLEKRTKTKKLQKLGLEVLTRSLLCVQSHRRTFNSRTRGSCTLASIRCKMSWLSQTLQTSSFRSKWSCYQSLVASSVLLKSPFKRSRHSFASWLKKAKMVKMQLTGNSSSRSSIPSKRFLSMISQMAMVRPPSASTFALSLGLKVWKSTTVKSVKNFTSTWKQSREIKNKTASEYKRKIRSRSWRMVN